MGRKKSVSRKKSGGRRKLATVTETTTPSVIRDNVSTYRSLEAAKKSVPKEWGAVVYKNLSDGTYGTSDNPHPQVGQQILYYVRKDGTLCKTDNWSVHHPNNLPFWAWQVALSRYGHNDGSGEITDLDYMKTDIANITSMPVLNHYNLSLAKGSTGWCAKNAYILNKKDSSYEMYRGYIIHSNTKYVHGHVIEHVFNVKDGIVYDPTNITINPKDHRVYLGVPTTRKEVIEIAKDFDRPISK